MTENGAIYARLVNSTGISGGVATKNITNVDKLPPTVTFVASVDGNKGVRWNELVMPLKNNKIDSVRFSVWRKRST